MDGASLHMAKGSGREGSQSRKCSPGRRGEGRVLFWAAGDGGDRGIALHVDMSVSVEVVHVGRRRMQPGGQEGQSGI